MNIIFPCFNEKAVLEQFMHSMQSQTKPPEYAAMFDNGSSDGSAEEFISLCKKMNIKPVLLRQERNIGLIRAYRSCLAFMRVNDEAWTLCANHEEYYDNHLEVLSDIRGSNPNAATVYSLYHMVCEHSGRPLQDMCSRFDTRNMAIEERLYTTILGFGFSNPLYSNHKSSCLRQCEDFQFCRGGDHALLANLSLYGDIICTGEYTFKRNLDTKRTAEKLFRSECATLNSDNAPHAEFQNLSFWFNHYKVIQNSTYADETKRILLLRATEACVRRGLDPSEELKRVLALANSIDDEVFLAASVLNRVLPRLVRKAA